MEVCLTEINIVLTCEKIKEWEKYKLNLSFNYYTQRLFISPTPPRPVTPSDGLRNGHLVF
jgi:hypothetical protein